jgi:hypothetical protein
MRLVLHLNIQFSLYANFALKYIGTKMTGTAGVGNEFVP